MRCVKPGVGIAKVYAAAAEELTRGLKDLGILRGSVSDLVKKGAFKPWFPHGIGHSLGIDVHDVTPDEPRARLDILQPGMVITIEPGLYFNKGIRGLPKCGVRIEDDVLVTEKGYSILSEGGFPKELDQVLELVGG
jgi:Xaa-Pro aminopeptidase